MRLIDADALWEQAENLDKKERRFVRVILSVCKSVDAVPVETVAQMFFDFTGDKCPCNFNGNDEWLPLVCEYEAEGKCPDPEDVLGCWKQYIKHYGERKDGGT